MADYFGHWLTLGASAKPDNLPRVYFVNWFRKDDTGQFVWPGFGENCRVLKWISERLSGRAEAVDSPIGFLPAAGSLDVTGLGLDAADLDLLLTMDAEAWRREVALIPPFYEKFGSRLPQALWTECDRLGDLLGVSPRSGPLPSPQSA